MLGDEVFRKHDTNNSGTLEIAEFPFMIDDFFQRIDKPKPSVNDCFFLMYKYDQNRDGKLDIGEFRQMIREIVKR